MLNNLLGILISFVFVFALIVISSILDKKKLLSKEETRKLIHIGVSHWWLIAMAYFNNIWYASVAPIFFILVNYLSYRFNLIQSMERDGNKNDLGTVYFPISLLLLVLITFRNFSHPYVGALGVLVMGYGDGLAAILGKKYGKRKFHVFGNEKSILGSLTMFFASFVVSMLLLSLYAPKNFVLISLIVAAFATLVEGISPFGLDNLTVPIFTSLLYQILFFR